MFRCFNISKMLPYKTIAVGIASAIFVVLSVIMIIVLVTQDNFDKITDPALKHPKASSV